jgi:hypothetical protein
MTLLSQRQLVAWKANVSVQQIYLRDISLVFMIKHVGMHFYFGRKNEVQQNLLACMQSSVVNIINGVLFQKG